MHIYQENMTSSLKRVRGKHGMHTVA